MDLTRREFLVTSTIVTCAAAAGQSAAATEAPPVYPYDPGILEPHPWSGCGGLRGETFDDLRELALARSFPGEVIPRA